MNSFYGGRQGHSFIISKVYSSIEEMVKDFGKEDCSVNFDEYVLINTENKNLPSNGNIYKRGFDFNGEIEPYHTQIYGKENYYGIEKIKSNGAEYVGNISGPAGPAPTFKFGDYDEIKNMLNTAEITFEALNPDFDLDEGEPSKADVIDAIKAKEKNFIGENENKKDFFALTVKEGIYTQYYYYNGEEWYNTPESPVTSTGSFNITDKNLVPTVRYIYDETSKTPKYEKEDDGIYTILKDDKFNDSIEWVYTTVRDENLEDSIAHIGFKVVAPVTDFIGEIVPSNYDGAIVERSQDQTEIESHPFYSRWRINVPKAVKNPLIKNLREVDFGTEMPLDLEFGEDGSVINVREYSNHQQDRDLYEQGYKVKLLVYDYIVYDLNDEIVNEYLVYFGTRIESGQVITGITVGENGRTKIKYAGMSEYEELSDENSIINVDGFISTYTKPNGDVDSILNQMPIGGTVYLTEEIY